jgi:hypothetical protein
MHDSSCPQTSDNRPQPPDRLALLLWALCALGGGWLASRSDGWAKGVETANTSIGVLMLVHPDWWRPRDGG